MMLIAAGGGALLAAAPANATWTVTIEKAGVQNTTATLDTKGTENFDSFPVANANSSASPYADTFGGAAKGNYYNYSILAANGPGGAGGTGNYISASNVTGANTSTAISLSSLSLNNGQSVNYFGLWWSAVGTKDVLTFYKNGGTQVFQISGADLANMINAMSNGADYQGNPNSQFSGAAKPADFAYVNFYSDDSFDKVTFGESAQENFESDNHTVGHYTTISPTGAVPEPATWAMMLGGFGLVGGAMRRRQSGLAALA